MIRSDNRVNTAARDGRAVAAAATDDEEEMADLRRHQSSSSRSGEGDCGDVEGTGALVDVTGRKPAPKVQAGDEAGTNRPMPRPAPGNIGHLGRREPDNVPMDSPDAPDAPK